MKWTSSTAIIVGVPGEHGEEELHRHFAEALAEEALVEHGGLRRVSEVEAEQDAEQRDPRHEARIDAPDDLAQPPPPPRLRLRS